MANPWANLCNLGAELFTTSSLIDTNRYRNALRQLFILEAVLEAVFAGRPHALHPYSSFLSILSLPAIPHVCKRSNSWPLDR